MSTAAPADIQRRVGEAHTLFVRGDLAGAERALNAVIADAPGDVNATHLLAMVKRNAGKHEAALALFDAAAQHAPGAAAIQVNRANLLLEMERHAEALAGFDRAQALGFDHPTLGRGRALALAGLGRFDEALPEFEASVRADAGDAEARFGLGSALQAAGRLEEALAAYDQAIVLAPDHARAHHNRAVLLHWLNRRDEALAAFDAALALRADHGPTLYSKGMALLSFGDYQRGWPLHEQRRRPGVLSAMRDHARGEPAWRGERVAGALRVWPEQGPGDEILFARLAPLACAHAERVILECDPRLVPLFARSFFEIEVRAFDQPGAPAAAQIPCGSLGPVMDVRAEQLDGAAYLRADPARVTAARARYVALAKGRPIVGIAWRSANPAVGRHKSVALSDWAALLTRDCLFINLQYGDTREEIAAAEAAFGCVIHTDPEIDQMRSLDAFAAQIVALDRIVSASNTTVHLAGALGAPCLVLVPPAQGLFWYWGAAEETTPWYSSVRILRRAPSQSWATQIDTACAHLDR